MRAILQRVSQASVKVENQKIAQINRGMLILLGIRIDDSEKEAELLAKKTANLRIFSDENDKMNLSIVEIGGQAIVVSQFTLYGNCKKGRRPSFVEAAPPEKANSLYHYYIEYLKNQGISVQMGKFQAIMQVNILNEGPVTIILDSDKLQNK